MQTDQPEVSVNATVRNVAASIGAFVDRLLAQRLDRPWELVVSCGTSVDGTWEVLSGLQASYPKLKVVEAPRRGIPAGRNAALAASSGRFIVTCDVDDSPGEGWLAGMVDAVTKQPLVAGRIVLSADVLDSVPDPEAEPSLAPMHFLPFGLTANLAFARYIADSIGGFDETMTHGDDVDFCWRAQQAGYELSRCDAVVFKRPRKTARARFRQHYLYGKTDVRLYEKHRHHGMRRHLGTSLRVWSWIVLAAPLAPWTHSRRWTWMGVAGHRLGRLIGSVQQRCCYP